MQSALQTILWSEPPTAAGDKRRFFSVWLIGWWVLRLPFSSECRPEFERLLAVDFEVKTRGFNLFCFWLLKRMKKTVVIQHSFVFCEVLWSQSDLHCGNLVVKRSLRRWGVKNHTEVFTVCSDAQHDPTSVSSSYLPWRLVKKSELLMCCGKWQTAAVGKIGAWELVTCFRGKTSNILYWRGFKSAVVFSLKHVVQDI